MLSDHLTGGAELLSPRAAYIHVGAMMGTMMALNVFFIIIPGQKAMVDADDAGIPLQLQVHDELDFSAESPDQMQYLAEIMRDAVPCNVPAVVDVESGPSWGEIK